MVQLRVDVEAARARSEFNATNRSVRDLGDGLNAAQRQADQLGDELTSATARADQAVRVFERAEQAADDAADEMNRLRQQVDALGSSAPQALVEQLRQAEDHLRDAEREEQRLRDRMEEAVQEQHRLNRAFNDGGDEVRRITRELALAQVEAARLRRIMDDANRRAANPLRGAQRGLLGFRRQIDQALSTGGRGLRDVMRDAWNSLPVEIKGAVIGAGVVMGLVFAEAVAATVNAALLATLGVGVLAAVVATAAKTSSAVRAAFSDTFGSIGDEIAALARDVAEGPLIRAAGIFGQTWDDIAGDVQGAFGDVGKYIEPLAHGLAGLVENVMPGLREGLKAAGPILDELAAALPEIGDAISDMFHSLSEGSGGATKGFLLLIATITGTLRAVGAVVGWLSRQFDTTTMFVADMLTLLSKIPGVGAAFEGVARQAREFAAAGTGAALTLDATGVAADQAASATRRQADATRRAASEAYDLTQNLGKLLDAELGVMDATIAWEKAWDDMTAAVQENGTSLDVHTSKGRANIQVVRDLADAARRQFEASIEAAGGQNASAAAVAAATQKYLADLSALREHAKALGYDVTKIDEIIAAYKRAAAMQNIVKTFTVEYRTAGSIPKDMRVGSGSIKGYASGVTRAPAGWAWVGEKGPELMRLRGGEQILSAMESARAAGARAGVTSAGAASGKPTVVNYNVYPSTPVGSTPGDVGKAVVEAIRAYERGSGPGWRS